MGQNGWVQSQAAGKMKQQKSKDIIEWDETSDKLEVGFQLVGWFYTLFDCCQSHENET